MKHLLTMLTLVVVIAACSSSKEEQATEDHSMHQSSSANPEEGAKKHLSPRTMAMTNVGINHVHIDYGSPSKRGRMIFGGLVGFGQVWATGAHHATNITFGEDVTINGTNVPAGKYGLFTIPGEKEWIIIISKDWDMHLADDYTEANDVVRIQSLVTSLDEVVESLTFAIADMGDGLGNVSIKWDQTSVSFDIQNK
ncbi:MAG: DUF2911 domain-containing protein [Marinoscillum sp.]|uniref:DUF2911 domain-containing protein n=1 Tax=Marinoscillum sp. TaxID=2024838 RepID=UPI0032FD5964